MRLVGYLVASYAVAYVLHIPVHHGFTNPIIPAAVPWAIAAVAAVVRTVQGRDLRPAWWVLAAGCAFFLSAHLLPHH